MRQTHLKQTITLRDHVRQALGGSQVLIQVFLVRTSGGVFFLHGSIQKKNQRSERVPSHAIPTSSSNAGMKAYLGDKFSFFRMFRWKREGAKHTAMFMGVI